MPDRVLLWVGSSKDDLNAFPPDVQDVMGFALWVAQTGGKHPDAKPLQGFGGAGVLEVVDSSDGAAYRVVYTLTLPDAVYVLHAFQEEVEARGCYPKAGAGYDPATVEMVRGAARAGRAQTGRGATVSDERRYEVGSGNVFADLGHPDPATALAKAKLARQIGAIIAHNGWTQAQAATMLGIDQPKVSAVVRGRLRDFSTERLMHFLTRLGCDIEISVVQRPSPDRPGRIAVFGEAEPPAASAGDRAEPVVAS